MTQHCAAFYYYFELETCCSRICCIPCIEETDAGGVDSMSTASGLQEQIAIASLRFALYYNT